MKNRIILILLFFSPSIYSQYVSESMAVKMANNYFQRIRAGRAGIFEADVISHGIRVPEQISPLGKANMWLVPVDDGWILLSGSTKATPILAHIQSYNKKTDL